MENYEYLTSEDLGYSPDVIQRAEFEYSPLGQAFNKVFKKDNKVGKDKYDNDLKCDSYHNFNKYRVSNFNEISSTDSKFDTINKFYKDFKILEDVKSKNKEVKKEKKRKRK